MEDTSFHEIIILVPSEAGVENSIFHKKYLVAFNYVTILTNWCRGSYNQPPKLLSGISRYISHSVIVSRFALCNGPKETDKRS